MALIDIAHRSDSLISVGLGRGVRDACDGFFGARFTALLGGAAVVRYHHGRKLVVARPGAVPATLIVLDPGGGDHYVMRPVRPWGRLLANLRVSTLDQQLAAGRPPESNVVLAARAQRLASPVSCRALAADWERILELSRRPQPTRYPHIPVCRVHVKDAEPELRTMLTSLLAPSPRAARGVAIASSLLRDGAGPVFNRHSEVDLVTALRSATEYLDASTSLATLV